MPENGNNDLYLDINKTGQKSVYNFDSSILI